MADDSLPHHTANGGTSFPSVLRMDTAGGYYPPLQDVGEKVAPK